MGPARIKTLSDLRRFEANLRVTCGADGCRHSAVYPAEQIISYFHHKKWNPTWELVGLHFRCEQCGHKGAVPSLAPFPSRPPPPPPLNPLWREPTWAELKRDANKHRG